MVNKGKIINQAQKYIAKGSWDKAIRELQKLTAEDPEDVRTLLKLGDVYSKKGDKENATRVYKQVAESYSQQGFFLKAVAVYKQILKHDAKHLEVTLKLAELYQHLGLTSEAMSQFQTAAQIHEERGATKASLEILKQMAEIDAENVAARIKLAESYSRSGQKKEAVAEFGLAADVLKKQNRWDDFAKVAERLVYHEPERVDVLKDLARYYLKKNDAKRALAKLQVCFKSHPKDADTLTLLAQAFTELGQTQKTLFVYRELARVYQDQGLVDRHRAIEQQIATLDPHGPEAAAAAAPASAGRRPSAPLSPISPGFAASGTAGTAGTSGARSEAELSGGGRPGSSWPGTAGASGARSEAELSGGGRPGSSWPGTAGASGARSEAELSGGGRPGSSWPGTAGTSGARSEAELSGGGRPGSSWPGTAGASGARSEAELSGGGRPGSSWPGTAVSASNAPTPPPAWATGQPATRSGTVQGPRAGGYSDDIPPQARSTSFANPPPAVGGPRAPSFSPPPRTPGPNSSLRTPSLAPRPAAPMPDSVEAGLVDRYLPADDEVLILDDPPLASQLTPAPRLANTFPAPSPRPTPPRATGSAPTTSPSPLIPPRPPTGDTNVIRILTETDVFIKYGLREKALNHLRRIFEIDPDNLAAHEKMLDLYQAMGDAAGAAETTNAIERIRARKAAERDLASEARSEAKRSEAGRPDSLRPGTGRGAATRSAHGSPSSYLPLETAALEASDSFAIEIDGDDVEVEDSRTPQVGFVVEDAPPAHEPREVLGAKPEQTTLDVLVEAPSTSDDEELDLSLGQAQVTLPTEDEEAELTDAGIELREIEEADDFEQVHPHRQPRDYAEELPEASASAIIEVPEAFTTTSRQATAPESFDPDIEDDTSAMTYEQVAAVTRGTIAPPEFDRVESSGFHDVTDASVLLTSDDTDSGLAFHSPVIDDFVAAGEAHREAEPASGPEEAVSFIKEREAFEAFSSDDDPSVASLFAIVDELKDEPFFSELTFGEADASSEQPLELDERVESGKDPEIEDELEEVAFLLEAELFAEAREALEDVLARAPRYPRAMQMLAVLEQAKRQSESDAEKDESGGYEEPDLEDESLDGNTSPPLDEQAGQDRYDEGMLYKEIGRIDDAVVAFKDAIRAGVRVIGSREMIGHCLREKGDVRSAIKHFVDALRQGASGDAAINLKFEIGLAHEQLGEGDKAIEWFRACHKDAPQHRGVAEKLRSLGAAPVPSGEVRSASNGKYHADPASSTPSSNTKKPKASFY